MTASLGTTDEHRLLISLSGQLVEDASEGHQDEIWEEVVVPLDDWMKRLPAMRLKDGSASTPMNRIKV
jgi:uncharacterized protein YicC (UPF0701 family)